MTASRATGIADSLQVLIRILNLILKLIWDHEKGQLE